MQKAGIVLAMSVWVFISAVILKSYLKTDADMILAFNTVEYEEMEATVSGYGKYEVSDITDTEKKALIIEVASSLGLGAPYEIQDEDRNGNEILFIRREGLYADSLVELADTRDGLYVRISLCLKDNLSAVYSYEELIQDIFDKKEVDGNVNIYLEGRIAGALNNEERRHIADIILGEMDADIISENNEEIYTIYAYSDRVDSYITSIGRKINLNLSVAYNEDTNHTIIYLASPINNLDY